MFPGSVGARTAFRMPASRLSDVSLKHCHIDIVSRRRRRRRSRERRFNREADSNAIRRQGYPQPTFAKECFGWWVVTSDPLLTSAKWVAYGTQVSVGNIDDILCQGLCTGPDGSIFSLVEILCG